MKFRRLRIEELLPILLAGAGVVGITPLIFVRLWAGDYLLAAVDVLFVTAECAVIFAVYRYRTVRLPSILLAILSALTVLVVVYSKGREGIFWLYPMVVASFFLLRPREAVMLTVALVLAIVPKVIDTWTLAEAAVIASTFFVTIVLACAFAVITKQQRRQLKRMTLIDPLTGVGNRRALDEALDELPRVSAEAVSMVLLDIDFFKRINDKHGHAVGDEVLVAVADCIRQHIRGEDCLFRMGGEEFVVLTRSAGIDVAKRLGESLRGRIAALTVHPGDLTLPIFNVTVSLGVAERLPGESYKRWYRRADDALYEAKRGGRNRVCPADGIVQLSDAASAQVTAAAQGTATVPRAVSPRAQLR